MSHRALSITAAFLLVVSAAFAQSLPVGVAKGPSMGGVTEYDFPNGLKVLLYPDQASPKVTINMTYLVGSRFEGYGETGMAHLLEHMNFIETTNGRKIKDEITARGAEWNGSTSEDRTNYYETVVSTDDNLKWALGLEADRMIHVKMAKELLDTEMTVVRNEFERGENSPARVLDERVTSTAYLWHNYGKSTIGSREDIERVPIDRLEAFYKKYYQPDNAVLVLAGKIDEAKALAMVADTIGKIPRPARKLDQPYTVEPPQDGERYVELRRVGQNKEIIIAYHGPAAGHADSAALQVLSGIMSNGSQGRLYKALVDTKKADSAGMGFGLEHDPGLVELNASLNKDQSQDEVKKILIDTVEGVIANPPTNDEMDQVKTRLIKGLENRMGDPQGFGLGLSGAIAQGDWRLTFLQHSRLKDVSAADVVRVAKSYLKASNRTVGLFIPDPAPDRTVVPETPDLDALLKNFKTDVNITRGEAFDPSPAAIESRIKRSKLTNGMKVVMLKKQTANSRVSASIEIEFGDQATLVGKNAPAVLAGQLLIRGSKNHTRQQIQELTTMWNAQVQVLGSLTGATARVSAPAENFEAALRLAVEILRDPVYPESEFDQLRTQRVKALEIPPTEPAQLIAETLGRHLAVWAKGDALYNPTREEQLAAMRAVTLDEVKKFHDQFYGASHGTFGILGPIDEAAAQKLAQELLGSWTTAGPFNRLIQPYKKIDPMNQKVEAPDKANAQFQMGQRISITRDNPDYPALTVADYILGGSISARIPDRIRNREGLSYSVQTAFSAPAEGNSAIFQMAAISNPANAPKVEASFLDEIRKALRDGFTADEVAKAKKALADADTVSRSSDGEVLDLMVSDEKVGRTLAWDAQMDAKVQALTPEQVSAAFRKYIDPAQFSIAKAGDFKAAGVYQ